ncbi:ankyrin repeat domain-containing protein 7-like isoform X3 [Sarcophilus harrisii]|uniref:ankyrin repeat domain-containing protein 7-like isoform X3 n=1 Tax=Sarcophilus harrisii TaxID=9305 RepID=UPI001301F574|nr:ankyrin repeat domain-containing protein 7-like isoform X3 [Sarcophilus harrisii]
MKKIFNFGRKKGQSPPRPFIKLPSYFGVQTPYPTEGYQIRSKDLGKIHKAALLGDVAKVQQLLLLGKSTVNDLDKMKRTPLHLACANGYPDVVSLLVERKCELNLLDNDSRTPLIKAIECQQEECATILLEHGADPNLGDSKNNNALHYIASGRTKFMAEKLIKHKIDIEAKNKEGFTPLLLAITTMNTEMADFLLKNGANVNALDSCKRHIYHKQIEKQKELYNTCSSQISCSEKASSTGFALGAPSLDKKEESSAEESISRLSDNPGPDDHLPSTDKELDFDTEPIQPTLQMKDSFKSQEAGKGDDCALNAVYEVEMQPSVN